MRLATLALFLAASLFVACQPASPPAEKPAAEMPPATTEASTEESAAPSQPTANSLLPKGLQPAPGLLTGGQPDLAQFQKIWDLGYRTAVNLRPDDEPDQPPTSDIEKIGFNYVSIPIGSTDDLNDQSTQALADVLATTEEPVLVYCRSGNRVGALFALKAFDIDGLSAEDALKVGFDHGLTRLEPDVRARLGLPN